MITIKLHSVVDIITNSSTTIFTYQDGSVKVVKELVDEILKVSGITDKTADDIFYYGLFYDMDRYIDSDLIPDDYPERNGDYGSEERNLSIKTQNDWFENLQKSILSGLIEKPQWMVDVEDELNNNEEYEANTFLTLLTKDKKYQKLANKLLSFLNSTDHEATRNG